MRNRWVGSGLLGLWLMFSAATSASIELVSRIEGEPPLVDAPTSASNHPSISADGRFVAFDSSATNLVAGANNLNLLNDIFVYDRNTETTERLSMGEGTSSSNPSISADGRFVVFQSRSDSFSIFRDTKTEIFVYDRDTNTTELLMGGVNSTLASISADGRFVVFQREAFINTIGDTTTSVFVYDRDTDTTELLRSGKIDVRPAISADGRFVALVVFDDNPGAGEGDDVFVYDRNTDGVERLTSGVEQAGRVRPSISADGRFVAYVLRPNDLTATGTPTTWCSTTETPTSTRC